MVFTGFFLAVMIHTILILGTQVCRACFMKGITYLAKYN